MDDLINEYVEVRAEKEWDTLSVKFLRFISYEDFVSTVEHEYDLIRRYRLTRCLIDLRLLPVYDTGMPEYVNDVWFPTVSSLGVRQVAFVMPEEAFGQMSMSRAHKGTETIAGMAVEHFKDREAAVNWLKTATAA